MPMPEPLTEELKQFRTRFGAISGWIFAGERKPDQPMDRHSSTNGSTLRRRRPSSRSSKAGSGTRIVGSGQRSESITR